MKLKSIVQEIYQAAMDISEPYDSLSKAEKKRALGLLTRFEELEAKHGVLPLSDSLRPILLSKNGRYDEALALAEKQFKQAPSWETAVATANAARRAGDLERAIVMFAKGAKLDPDDESCLLDIGDIHLELEQYADALKAYKKVLVKDSEHQWALPSAFYCRHKLGIKGNWLASLKEVANQEGCTCGQEGCLTAVFGGYGASAGIERAEYLLSIIR